MLQLHYCICKAFSLHYLYQSVAMEGEESSTLPKAQSTVVGVCKLPFSFVYYQSFELLRYGRVLYVYG